jgi:hypothetical protein
VIFYATENNRRFFSLFLSQDCQSFSLVFQNSAPLAANPIR